MQLREGAHYVAMGSSFGAGPGLKPRASDSPRKSGRSAVNYAHLIAARLSLDLSDVTYSGATTRDLLQPSASGVTAQVDAVRADTRLVTITAGGNDVGYLPTITFASLPRVFRQISSIRERIERAMEPPHLDIKLNGVKKNLVQLVDEIHDRAPKAKVVLLDYLTILPKDTAATDGEMPVEIATWAEQAARRLTRTFEDVAEQTGCLFPPVADRSRTHHAWANEPWTRRFHYSLRGGAPYHPNLAGMRAVEEMLGAALLSR
jgi:lysophospholipase L1-like esterase